MGAIVAVIKLGTLVANYSLLNSLFNGFQSSFLVCRCSHTIELL